MPEDGLYHYLLQPGEEHDDQRKRATDRIWPTNEKTYRLREIVEDPGNRVMYYLKDGPERAFVKEELILILEDTEIMFRSGNIYPTGINIANGDCELFKSFSLIELLFSQRRTLLGFLICLELFGGLEQNLRCI